MFFARNDHEHSAWVTVVAPVASILAFGYVGYVTWDNYSQLTGPSSTARWLLVLTVNPAAFVRPPSGAHTRREGRFLTIAQLWALKEACAGPYADVVPVLGLAGLRWGELSGLQVGDVVELPGAGLRLQRTVLASRADGRLFVDTLKNKRPRTVPLVADLVPIVAGRAAGKRPADWLFAAPAGGPLSEAN